MSDSIESLPSPTKLEFNSDNLDKDLDLLDNIPSLPKTPKTQYSINNKFNISNKKHKNKKKKCKVCKKKLGLLPFKCKCEHIFCSLHRYAEDHNCTFNYKDEYMTNFNKNNPKVVAEKIAKI